jgi:hypothetical protein
VITRTGHLPLRHRSNGLCKPAGRPMPKLPATQ